MTFDDLAGRSACWLDGSGVQSTLVISSRVRLARNLQDVSFVRRASEAERRRIIEAVTSSCRNSRSTGEMTFFDASDLSQLQRQLLVERHLISPALAKGRGPRGVLVEPDEALSILVNEEDHLRVQSIASGFRVHEAWRAASQLERKLASELAYAYSEKWGYLTACPTNTGTGLRASIFVHLPGLVLTQEMDGVTRGIAQMGFTVRGLYGEGTDSAGNFYQVSNQITLGRSEGEIMAALEKVTAQLVACEENARDVLMRDAGVQIEDKIWRACGILKHARLLTSREFMNFSSAIRLGIGLGILSNIDIRFLNEMMIRTRPAHLQYRAGQDIESRERDAIRAEMVRRQMAALGDP